jgi:hypothetical protein
LLQRLPPFPYCGLDLFLTLIVSFEKLLV